MQTRVLAFLRHSRLSVRIFVSKNHNKPGYLFALLPPKLYPSENQSFEDTFIGKSTRDQQWPVREELEFREYRVDDQLYRMPVHPFSVR